MSEDNELIEIMARAIYAADEGIEAEANEAHINAWFGPDKTGDGDWPEDYRNMARAALTAYRNHQVAL